MRAHFTPPESCPLSGLAKRPKGQLLAEEGRTASGALQKLSVVDINPCPLPRIMATECCGHREGGNASGCLGHAGNPVMCQTTEARQWVLTGVLSKGGARCYGPFLYTRVSYYSDWIVSTTARCGSPTSPIVGSRGHAGFRAPAEGHGEIPDPLLNSANFPEDDSSLPDTRQSGENGQERPSLPGAPRALPNPLYYDYYSGEEIPISMGMPGQPGGLRGAISGSLLLHFLSCWMAKWAETA
ncbi:Inactive serine protease 54 [Varanus komodoensis]|nr:Inactive serine protease 54 [Varanus komodoensis]